MLAPISNTLVRYRSYLIRLWQERPADGASAHAWRAEVEHIQTGERRRFVSPDELWRYLHRQTAPGNNDPASTTDEA